MAKTVKAIGWGTKDPSGILSPLEFTRRTTGDHDVQFQVLYCGVCHSDLHLIKNDWGFAKYPMIPGHEIVGVVTEIGANVDKFKVGDKVAVGVMVGSCRKCEQCATNLENYCNEKLDTYNGLEPDGSLTYGGYSDLMVADQDFVFRWPDNLPMDRGAPLVCAGITTYSPIRYYGLDKPGLHVGVAGLGGLGHLAVKFLKAFGAKVTVIDISPEKKSYALETLGADQFLLPNELEQANGTLDAILDAISVFHSIQSLLSLLKPHGKLVVVGLPEKPLELPMFALATQRKMIGGSMIGGTKETQEMLDFAAKHNIVPDVEVISMDYINTAMERLARGDVKYRFVIDVGNSLKA
ncbi:Probable cinnamyl alcohol dehydrogenase 9 [Striga hermonthica]|uniref:Probable cinnamyl alcohol dehydrogenase 9 n=1 Tax=Striga hermonthica TaxID=68872 RepID=A0A9N7N769_STRHE|nr:Probable cinnamyl alcohol dehydrogenase 9 [Striga hermonthica]